MHALRKQLNRVLGSFLLSAVFLAPVVISGCAERSSYRVYDNDHHDYHQWNRNEVVFYAQWENDTHRQHKDFRKRSSQEQQQYWDWRHDHGDHGHDHDSH